MTSKKQRRKRPLVALFITLLQLGEGEAKRTLLPPVVCFLAQDSFHKGVLRVGGCVALWRSSLDAGDNLGISQVRGNPFQVFAPRRLVSKARGTLRPGRRRIWQLLRRGWAIVACEQGLGAAVEAHREPLSAFQGSGGIASGPMVRRPKWPEKGAIIAPLVAQ